MNRPLILSVYLVIRSDDDHRFACVGAAQAAPQTRTRPAPARVGAARLTDRDVQALRPAELPLRQRAGSRAEAVSGDQPAEWTSTQRLRTQCTLLAGHRAAWQFSPAARITQRDL